MTRGTGVGFAVGAGGGVEVEAAAGLAELSGGCEVEGSAADGKSLLGGVVSTPHAEQATNSKAMADVRFTSVETITRDECYGGALRH